MSFGSAILLGIGFMIGVTIFIFALIIIIGAIKGKKGKFTPEMFEEYKKELIADERYEEMLIVDEIIKGLEEGKPNTKLLSNYEVKSNSELILDTKKEDQTAIRFKDNPKVVLKTKKKSKKK
jgi:hypothetical protein